jgi:hypothetical protein
MNDLKECITSQDYVETFDQLKNAGITEVRICYSEAWEREDDGKRISGSTVDYVSLKLSKKTLKIIDKSINPDLGKEDAVDELIIEGGWTPKKGDDSIVRDVNIPNLIFTESFLAILTHPVHKEYENFDDEKDSGGYFYWNVSSRTITLKYDGGSDKFRDSDPDQFHWWSEEKYKQELTSLLHSCGTI